MRQTLKTFTLCIFFENEVENDVTQHEDISITHLNARSLNDNFDNLVDLLENSLHSFNVVC